MRASLAERLHLARMIGDVDGDRLARGDQLGVALLLLDRCGLRELRGVDPFLGRGDLAFQFRDLSDERDEAGLERADGVQLVLRIHHLRGEAVALRLERLELGAARQLLFEFVIDVRAERIEAVEPHLQLFDERHTRTHARNLCVELGHRLVQARRFLGALFDELQLAEDRVHLRFQLGGLRGECGDAVAEGFKADAIRAELLGELGRFCVRLIERLNVGAQNVQVGAALTQRVHLPRRLLRQLVGLREALVERLERELLLGEVVGLDEQRLEALGQTVDLLRERDEVLVLGGERGHPRLRIADADRECLEALVERLELLFLQLHRVDLAADQIQERRCFFLQLAGVAFDFLTKLRGVLELRVGLVGDLLGARERVVGARDLLDAFVQLADLDVHRPDHLVDAVGLDHGVLDRVLLALERLGFVRDVFGQRIQRRETLFGALAQLVKTRQRAELVLDLFHRRHRGGRVLAGFARGVLDLFEVLGQGRGQRANLVELRLERAGLAERLLHVAVRLLQLRAEILERRAFLLQRLERRLGAERLRRQVLDRLAMLLEFAVRPQRFLRRLFGLLRRLL